MSMENFLPSLSPTRKGNKWHKHLHSNIKEVNDNTTRSCKILDGPTLPSLPTNTSIITTPSNTKDAPPKKQENKILVQVPFLQALRSIGKVSEHQDEIIEHLKQVKINLFLLM